MQKNQFEINKESILAFVLDLSSALLKAGAETYRVEETAKRILDAKKIEASEVFVIPTGMFISCRIGDEIKTVLRRVNHFNIDLEKINEINNISRMYSSDKIPLEGAKDELNRVETMPKYNHFLNWIGASMGGGFSVFLFGGSIIDFCVSFVASGFTIVFFNMLSKYRFNFFIKNIFAGFIAGLLGFVFVKLLSFIGFDSDIHLVTVGPLMTLVPGVALTNAMRDIISGDLVAGGAKMMEAIFVAIGLAIGVGTFMRLLIDVFV